MKPIAFTRKDIVVVLVCIVFLIANIAAIGDNGRKRAKQAVCLSNLMKWGQVFQAYTSDNNGYFHTREVGTPQGYFQIWPYTYKPYYSDPTMRFCPTAVNPDVTTGPFGTWNTNLGAWDPTDPLFWVPGENQPLNGSYGINRYILDMQGGGYGDAFWKRAGVKGTDKVPVLMDCQYVTYWADSDAPPPLYDGAFNYSMQLICINRHEGFINTCFLDFSARKVGLKEIWTLKHSRTYDTCGPWTICGGVQPNDWPQWMRDFEDY